MTLVRIVTIALVVGTTRTAVAVPDLVETFESIGVTWAPVEGRALRPGVVQYRELGTEPWLQGHPLWFDDRDGEYRGSLVGLRPDTQYQIELQVLGSQLEGGGVQASETVTWRTWREDFPIGTVHTLDSGTRTQPLVIEPSDSGDADSYTLFTATPGADIDVGRAFDYGVVVQAHHVIVRGLTVRNARVHGVFLDDLNHDVHDVVIEECDISRWGSVGAGGWGVDGHAAIGSTWRAAGDARVGVSRIVIQRNWLHDPFADTNSWSEYNPVLDDDDDCDPLSTSMNCHPAGPNAVALTNSEGRLVIRYNTVTTTDDRYLNDGFGAHSNYSAKGFPNRDSDIYGNYIERTWDDGIESEGANRNVRIWGNFIDATLAKIAVATTHVGPAYVFGNVAGTSRREPVDPASSRRGPFLKNGTRNGWGGGRLYVFHNTILQGPAADPNTTGVGGVGINGSGGTTENIVSRNNILHVVAGDYSVIDQPDPGSQPSGNDFDYDLFNGRICLGDPLECCFASCNPLCSGPMGANVIEPHGDCATPVYAGGTTQDGLSLWLYLASSSPGYRTGVLIPGFNCGADCEAGCTSGSSCPDVGAFDSRGGTGAPMEVGIDAYREDPPDDDGGPTADGGLDGAPGDSSQLGDTNAGDLPVNGDPLMGDAFSGDPVFGDPTLAGDGMVESDGFGPAPGTSRSSGCDCSASHGSVLALLALLRRRRTRFVD